MNVSLAVWRSTKTTSGFLVSAALSLLGLTCVTFVIGRFIPVDPVLAIVGDHATRSTYDQTRLALGLDRSIPEQFLIYLGKVLHGDLGTSVITSNPVLSDLMHFFPATLELATIATILGVLLGVPAGVVAGACKGRWPDHVVRIVGLFGYSMPVFWMGLMGLFLFYGKLNWVAGPGRIDAGYEDLLDPVTGVILIDSAMAGAWDVFRNALAHIVLPASILGYLSLAYIARMTRSFTIAQLSQEYTTTALIKGLTYWAMVWRHAFPNILVPLITVIGLSYATLLEGAVLTETVFAWPGLGLYITQSLFNADMNAVLGGTIVVGVVFIGINVLSDALYRLVDPRLRTA
ncbi:ABC transporter permease [Lichenihabitans psoromatis]|uniref:ABC transporter permease n=1 Tax=Lichenihabitans psoromatis TaxID=2528642 RepID=UPI0010384F6B|nr:ABC transporter permease [Lichenihabitans psoromatis]